FPLSDTGQGPKRFIVGQLGLDDMHGARVGRLRNLLERLATAANQAHGGVMRGQSERNRPSNAPARARDNGDLVLERRRIRPRGQHVHTRCDCGNPMELGRRLARPVGPGSYAATSWDGRRARSAPFKKSPIEVPVHVESTFGAPRNASTSSMLTVRKSILNRVRPVWFGTVECICAAEKIRR